MEQNDRAPEIVCDRCGKCMAAGSPHYTMKLQLRAGFDGWIQMPEAGETATDFIAACENLDSTELEAQVNQELAFTLCPPCRNHVALDPLGLATSSGSKTVQ